MLPQLAQILQDTLNFTRYAASPFVLNGRPDSIRQWLCTLREQLVAVVEKVDSAMTALGNASERDDADWTDEERVLSQQWVTRCYPNEPAVVQRALREAWRDGQRMRAAHPDSPPGGGGREFERLALLALRKLVPYDARNRGWDHAVQDYIDGIPVVRPNRYLDMNRIAIRDIFLRHGIARAGPQGDVPPEIYEAVDELLDHVHALDEYKLLYRETALDLGKIRHALNIPNDEIAIVAGTPLILETIAHLKRPAQSAE
ncbi:hypothetical protein PTKU64_91990 (plasmid) [Paraburkholderia terrae]|uniref:RsbT co-antagonist protein RsbRD N-terminal domain-containing protein n=1 Tax=Paraburkholderia terrae TaxID=311230 RepID=A0ABN6JY23_9BURK|nr:hypothetical protein [Paraburkholderia terrae]BCZ85524.1 hypothetical protein PTKU64_91990 [Paraburkholderia terrae]